MRFIIGSMEQPSRGWYLTLLAVIVVLALAGLSVWRGLRLPADGTDWAPDAWKVDGLRISPVAQQLGRLQAGDVVTTVDGTPLEIWARALLQPDFPRPRWQIGQIVIYCVLRDGIPLDVPVRLTRHRLSTILLQNWGYLLSLLASQIVGTFIFLQRPDDRAARIFFLSASCGTGAALNGLFGLHVVDIVDGLRFWLFRIAGQGLGLLFLITMLHFTLVFPRPLPLLSKRRWALPSIYALPFLFYVGAIVVVYAISSSKLVWLGHWTTAARPLFIIYALLTAVTLLTQYRVGSGVVPRRKIRWVMLAMWLSVGSFLFLHLLPTIVAGRSLISRSAQGLITLPIPVALAIAIWRHQLFDIDTLLNRALVYGALTAGTMGLYVAFTGSLGMLLQARGDPAIAFLATGLVVVLFQPLRERLQRAVDRLMYGERDNPYAVLSRLSQRLEAILEPSAVLPTVVETVAQSFKLPYTAITLKQNGTFTLVAAHGQVQDELVRLPLTYANEITGELLLAPRAPGEPFSRADYRLLGDLARQAGVAAGAVLLAADLERSRLRMLTAREETRRRLGGDLHDGLGHRLAGLLRKVDVAANLLDQDLTIARVQSSNELRMQLDEMRQQMRAAIDEVRRLAHALHPPELELLGLVGALRERVAQMSDPEGGLQVQFIAAETLPCAPVAVETAAYYIVLEALSNVQRHSGARRCWVRLEQSTGTSDDLTLVRALRASILELEIVDHGRGLAPGGQSGLGLISMRERALEVGGTCTIESLPDGGTRVLARLPCLEA